MVETYYSMCSGGGISSTICIVYKIERDTIIAGRNYHLLSSYRKGGYGTGYSCSNFTTTTSVDSGEDASDAKVFAMMRTDSSRVYFTLLTKKQSGWTYTCDSVGFEYLFYDFDLSIGSVVPGSNLGGGITVSTIDSVSLSNGQYVKRYNDNWVYGIGSKNRFVDYWHLYTCGPGPSVVRQMVLCYDNPRFNYHFSYPAGTLLGNLQYDCFDIDTYIDSITVVPTPAEQPLVSSLYPNPANTQITVTATDVITSATIITPVGKTIYHSTYSTNEIKIDISALPTGLYFIRVNDKDVRKLVKR